MISILLQLGQDSFPPGSASCHEGGLTNCISVWGLFVFLGPLSSYVLMAHSGSDLRSWWLWQGPSPHLCSLFSSLCPFGSACWVGPEPFSVCPPQAVCLSSGLGSFGLGLWPLVLLGASLRHLAGHLRADHWRQSLGSTVTSHSDHRRKEEEPLEGQEALLRREGLQKETLSEGGERRRGRSQLLGLKVFCSEGGHPETVCQHVNSCF